MTSWGILGAGFIGGSIARDLLFAGESVSVYDPHEKARTALADRGALEVRSLDELSRRCDIVVCAVPEERAPAAVLGLLQAGPSCLVVDTSQLKGRVIAKLGDLGRERELGRRCFPARPLVEGQPGWRQARPGLLRGEPVALCLEADWELDAPALTRIFELLSLCRGCAVFATAEEIDRATARYFQLPRLLAAGQAQTILEDPEAGILSGPAFGELTAPASRDPEAEARAIIAGSKRLEAELGRLIAEAEEWRELLRRSDLGRLRQRLARGEFARARLEAVRWQERPAHEVVVPATAEGLLEARGPARSLRCDGDQLHVVIG